MSRVTFQQRKREALVRKAQERAIEMRPQSPWDAQLVEDLIALIQGTRGSVFREHDNKSPVEQAMTLIEQQFTGLEPRMRKAFIDRFKATHNKLNHTPGKRA